MDGFKFDIIEGAPIVVISFTSDFKITPEMPLTRETKALLDGLTEPHFVIFDVDQVGMLLEDVINAANWAARNESTDEDVPLFKHPKIRQMIWATERPLFKLAVKGLKTASFGNLSVEIVDTLQEAIDYCYIQIG